MDKIICLVGASGSGKTTIAKELEKAGYNIIHSYTTRKPREENEWGHTFIPDWLPIILSKNFLGIENGVDPYVDPYKFDYIGIDEMIAHKEIYGYHYFATKEQCKDKGTSVYVVDPEGAKQVQANVKDAEVVTIFLIAEEVTRLRRMRKSRGIDGAHNRIYEDRLIFTSCKCDYVVDANREIDTVVLDVLEIIEQF